jgi:hypothetical protein
MIRAAGRTPETLLKVPRREDATAVAQQVARVLGLQLAVAPLA